MEHALFIGGIGFFVGVLIWWGFKTLPKEHWQIMAVVPRQKNRHGKWKGLNLTYYGVLSANAYTFAVVMFFILSAAVQIPAMGLCVLIVSLLAVCLPASRIVARVVEKKSGTLTVGGAVFVGTVAAPWLIYLENITLGKSMGFHISPMALLSAISIAYTFGEGLGRLACVSFGCCYGKPLDQCPPVVQKLFSRFFLVFTGPTKKIAYASGFDGEKVLPIQIITAILYSITGLAGTALYLNGSFSRALLGTLVVTQVWRFLSEFLRADFRGDFRITPYQIMALITLLYAGGTVLLAPAAAPSPRLVKGLSALWDPWMLIFVQTVWIASFLHTGRSEVTGSHITFHVEENRI